MPYNLSSPSKRYKALIESSLSKFVEIFKRDDRVFALVLSGCWGRDMGEEGCELDLYPFVKEEFFNEFSSLNWIKSLKETGIQVTQTEVPYSWEASFEGIGAEIEFRHEKWFSPQSPDFDLEVGNLFKHRKVLFEKGSEYEVLAKECLPFYSEEIRQKRLKQAEYEVQELFCGVRDHGLIRGDLMSGFDELYKALRWVVQFLFIKKRTYPVDYRKWLEYQFEKLLGMPELYPKIQNIVEFKELSKDSLTKKLREIKNIYDYVRSLPEE